MAGELKENPIESESHRERLLEDIRHWTEYTKASTILRSGDIESLVSQILGEFYHVKLSCGHLVEKIDDGVYLTFSDHDVEGREVEVHGTYCRVCAEEYKKKLGARETKWAEVGVC